MPLTVALVAQEGAGVHALRILADRGHRLAAVYSDESEATIGATVADAAGELGVSLRPAAEVRDPNVAEELSAAGVELVLNVHSLYVINPMLLAVPALGAFNLHPGPLPERAGLNAPSWALYEGAERHGVTLHRITARVDEGPVAFIERFELGSGDTALKVMTQCVRRGLALLERLLDLAEAGEPIPAHPQDLAGRRWFGSGPPEGGSLDWNRPARQVANFVRACDYRPFAGPWEFPRCVADGRKVAIASAEVLAEPASVQPGTVAAATGGSVLVAAADTWVRVDRVEVNGQGVSAAEVLRANDHLHRDREVAATVR